MKKTLLEINIKIIFRLHQFLDTLKQWVQNLKDKLSYKWIDLDDKLKQLKKEKK